MFPDLVKAAGCAVDMGIEFAPVACGPQPE